MKRIGSILIGTFLMAALLSAQDARSTLTGRVKDAQGAVIAGANVVVMSTETNVSRTLLTNATGYFEAPLLQPGPYQITVDKPGFKKSVRGGITLLAADRREVEVVLEVGAISDSVRVTADAALIDVSRTDSGRTLDEQSIAALPVMSNTVLTMIRFTPGVAAGVPTALLGPHSTQGAATDYSTGSNLGGNTWTIDGAVSDGSGRYTTNLPSVDAVAETKILTTTFDGSFGHSTGLGIAVVTKNGTNEFHGNVSDNYWSQRWQGASFFAKKTYYQNIAALRAAGNIAGADAAAAKPIQPSGHSNLYNFNVTGPIRIPKVFDGRNRVFFTLGYSGQRDSKPEETSTYNRIVPTEANKKGDFSDLIQVASNPGNYQLYDPYSTIPDPARAGHYIRTPLPNNTLPASYIALGKKFYDNYVKYYPNPNNWFDKTKAPDTNPYLSVDAPYNWKFGQWSGRADVNIGPKLRMFGRYTQNHFVEMRGDWTANIAPGLSGGNNGTGGGSGTVGVTRDDQNGVLDLIYTVTPSTVAHASFAISNWSSASSQGDYAYKYKPSDVGLPTYLDAQCGDNCYLPQFGISGYSTVGITGTPGPTYNHFNTYMADVYHSRGNHSIKIGLDIRQQMRNAHPGNNDGTYTFGNNYFRKCDDNCGSGYSPSNLGLAWASFMMGMPTGITISNNDSLAVQNPYFAGYITDTWRVNPKLTLTLSLRTEFEMGAKERYGRYIVGYDPNAKLPISDAVEAAYAKVASLYNAGAPAGVTVTAPTSFPVRGAAIYATAPGAPERAWANALMWLPRIGFGYQLDKKTVMRGGWGVYYDTNNVNTTNFGPNQNYYSKSTNPIISTTGANSIPVFDPAFSADGKFPTTSPLNNPFPVRANGTRFDDPLRDSLGAMATVGGGWTYNNGNIHTRQQRWRVSIERQILSHDVVEVSYEGTYSSNLGQDRIYNNPDNLGTPSSLYNFTQTRNDTISTWLNASVANANPFYGMTTSGTVPTNANAIYPASVMNNATLWQWMSTNSLFTSTNRTRSTVLFGTPNGTVSRPEGRFHSRTQMIEASYNHRFSAGLTANFGYTWLQRKDGTSYFQGWDPDDPIRPQVPYWNPIAAGQPQRITGTAVYELPFGKGKKFLSSNRFIDLAVGGWRLATTFQRQLGGLIGFGNIYYYGDVRNIEIDNPTPGHYFNTAGCVATAAAATDPGDIVVGTGPCTSGFEKRSANAASGLQYRFMPSNISSTFRAPGYTEIDASISRTFRIWERVGFDVRMDVLNVPNHSFLNGPDTGATGTNFGTITGQAQSPNRFIQIKGNFHW